MRESEPLPPRRPVSPAPAFPAPSRRPGPTAPARTVTGGSASFGALRVSAPPRRVLLFLATGMLRLGGRRHPGGAGRAHRPAAG